MCSIIHRLIAPGRYVVIDHYRRQGGSVAGMHTIGVEQSVAANRSEWQVNDSWELKLTNIPHSHCEDEAIDASSRSKGM